MTYTGRAIRRLEPIFRSHPTLITQLAEIEAARLLSIRDAARLSPAEHAEIEEVGFASFMRRKILSFLAIPSSRQPSPRLVRLRRNR